MKEYLCKAKEVVENLGSSKDGLTKEDAKKRLEKDGPNKLKEEKPVPLVVRFLKELADPMIIILIVAAAVSGVLAAIENESFADVIIIMAVVIINAVLGVFQESKAEKAIAALKEMTASMSKVLRNGELVSVKSEMLVKGDVIILEAGDSVPADARVLQSASMKVEEAALTGESVPVEKHAEALNSNGEKDVPLGDRKNMVYMGSTVVFGRGVCVVTATGMDTEMGRIAGALSQAKDEQTPLQKKLNQLSKILSFLVLGICAVIFAVDIFRIYPDINAPALIDTFMVAVSLAVAAIPEGLAAVVTIVLSIGVTNMSKRNAVIRKLTAVETLGCTQVICSDKTGTLTQNKMTVMEHFTSADKLLMTAMALSNDAELMKDGSVKGEPTECALVADAAKNSIDKNELKLKYFRIGEAPFESIRKMMSVVFRSPDGIIQFTKGAPDEVLSKCSYAYTAEGEVPLTDELRAQIIQKNKDYANRALRVLCAAYKKYSSAPEDFSASALENGMTYIGLSAMSDPIRPEVKVAIKECEDAGILPVMITGDHKDTASAIAGELGILDNARTAITGSQLEEMSDEEFEDKIDKIAVYARVQPEHKTRIVNTWRKKGYITAMTGDGVNDAPSIKSADIGVGMGITGTDVTKNVADMVLADDNFATIVSAVEEGRRIYDNIRKSIQFLLSSNLAEVFAIFVATLLGFTVLKPVHLLWINLITDCFPALALGMERAEADIMQRKPRDAKEGIFAGGMGFDVAFQGILIAAMTLFAYFTGHFIESGVWEIASSADGITMAFLTLSMTEIFHSFNMRSRTQSVFKIKGHNKVLWGAMALSLLLTTAVIYIPFLSSAFGFEHISLMEYAISMGIAVCIIPIMELFKLIRRSLKK